MFTYGQDPDVVRWGLQLFDGGPYCGYGPQNYTDCYRDQYSREEASYHTECITTENDKHSLHENTSLFWLQKRLHLLVKKLIIHNHHFIYKIHLISLWQTTVLVINLQTFFYLSSFLMFIIFFIYRR